MPTRKEQKARTAYETGLRSKLATIAGHQRALKKAAPKRVAKAVERVQAAKAQGNLDKHYHAVERMLHEVAFYPPHDKRKETPGYKKAHDDLVKRKNYGCKVCGVTYKTLGDPAKNPFGAVQMETHHHTIEWALANAIDTNKFNTRILPGLRRRNPKKYAQYKSGMTRAQILAWVDHDEDNLWVLCDVHHRHKYVGIHAITYPIWGPQDIVDEGLTRQEIIQAASGKKAAGKKASPPRKRATT